jgi:hypothetical protein
MPSDERGRGRDPPGSAGGRRRREPPARHNPGLGITSLMPSSA